MNLRKVLTLNSVKVGLTGKTKNDIIEELVDMIVANGDNLDKETLLQSVLDRESQMSTGMKFGVAIPHGKTDAVSQLYAVVAVSNQEVDFESLDGQASRIFIMTISPASKIGPHLEFLAEVSAFLTKESFRQKTLSADTDQALLDIFLGETH